MAPHTVTVDQCTAWIRLFGDLVAQQKDRLTELDASLPSALADVIDRALEKDPADRFADLGQMSRELQSLGRELAGDERPMARPSALLGPPGPMVNTARPATALDSTPEIDDPPLWSPDGREIVFSSNSRGMFYLYRKPVVGRVREEPLLASPNHAMATGHQGVEKRDLIRGVAANRDLFFV